MLKFFVFSLFIFLIYFIDPKMASGCLLGGLLLKMLD